MERAREGRERYVTALRSTCCKRALVFPGASSRAQSAVRAVYFSVRFYSMPLRRRAIIFPDQPRARTRAPRLLASARLYLAAARHLARGTTSITSSFLALSKQLITRPLFAPAPSPCRRRGRARGTVITCYRDPRYVAEPTTPFFPRSCVNMCR